VIACSNKRSPLFLLQQNPELGLSKLEAKPMNTLPLPAVATPVIASPPPEMALESQYYFGWKLELSQYYHQLSKAFNWKIINDHGECQETGSFNGEYEDLEYYFHKKVDSTRLMTQLINDWMFVPRTKTLTQDDFKDNPQAWVKRCRLLHMVRELEKMKGDEVDEFQAEIEDMVAHARKAIAHLEAEVTIPIAPVKTKKSRLTS